MTTNAETTTVHRSLGDLAAQRFPLVPRRKPACPPLIDRIGRVRHQADLASQRTAESLLRAAEAHDLTAGKNRVTSRKRG
ncbi:MAG: hypothetical protein HKP61_05390 [Dactylosporangium sp.]|nr:hypothetical protein [Dactylosporangium sp.]NNJ60381.1 hypothetical protein [Dactylosporangium sp.]